MPFESITDIQLNELRSCRKTVTNPNAKPVVDYNISRCTFKLVAEDTGREFEIFTRMNENNFVRKDFSCGLMWVAPGGERLILSRYNGDSHDHTNRLERLELAKQFHVHLTTERYIEMGLRADGFAIATDAYSNLQGTLRKLSADCHVEGFPFDDDIDQISLFSS